LLQQPAAPESEAVEARLPIQHELTLALAGRVSRLAGPVKGCTGKETQNEDELEKQVSHESGFIGFHL
jgi:hypothetical protein